MRLCCGRGGSVGVKGRKRGKRGVIMNLLILCVFDLFWWIRLERRKIGD